MTNLEAIKAIVGPNFPMDESAYILALEGEGLVPGDTYTGGIEFDKAVIALIGYFSIYVKRISEGGYTVEYDTAALWRLRSLLLAKWGIPDPEAAYIIDRTNRW